MADENQTEAVAQASALMREALLLLDAAGITLAATHLKQALYVLNEELEVH